MRARHFSLTVAVIAILAANSACSPAEQETESPEPTRSVTEDALSTTTEVTTSLLPGTTAERTTGAPPPTVDEASIMPNVVCMSLQDAQNAIQSAGVFFSRSEDATGRGRSQLVDSNWIVVSQTPTPGTPFSEGEAVLSAVKIGEPNPC
ncbi:MULTISPECIES: PASTA domain-containing protein [unclassified Gordonia (in: high G+C Gram-positive bacteria)]|uniref:PASTA domain-containing protein n=2 Tax=unclassified Gordonia (in: high G+C Gram-positive bacteria) TaxID=2657482 RepID=UPI000990D9A2|nr:MULTISPECIES: PASTA domain-containing protein [unclassified Gordonia (in: high G+C Gram-positive bacteria)]MBN0971149.1 PASTA domain-containing protein [Gordonia sp. BP-119]MBN0981769.1 PASTA domain-containing protein [Gordonia sp. BP-94]